MVINTEGWTDAEKLFVLKVLDGMLVDMIKTAESAKSVLELIKIDKKRGVERFFFIIAELMNNEDKSLCANFLHYFLRCQFDEYYIDSAIIDELVWDRPIVRRLLLEHETETSDNDVEPDWICNKILAKELELADEGFRLAYRNSCWREIWIEMIEGIMSKSSSFSKEGYELMEKWLTINYENTDKV